ncbi:hypothetical protein [Synechococcus sp. UW140]|uniref:hypothetical protein n=1 Tax=Synechococcus sp. UW140 TaxID=368503 RepID=UPI000E0F4FC0|nr:hypothetical protein [Synechococcus sp. UW140]
MKQLPGRQRPRWLQHLASALAGLVMTIWLVSLLPVLLLVGLVAGVLLLPVLRQLRRELESMESGQGPATERGEPLRNATPWYQRLRNQLRWW